MSKFCPFCDDVKDSELNGPEDLKEHLQEEHRGEVVEKGNPRRPDKRQSRNGLNVIEVESKDNEK